MPPPKGRSFPFAPRHSADWLVSHVTYDQAVDMFFNQTATQQNLGHDPLVYSKVFRGVTYATLQEAQQVFTETMNAEYEVREQRDLADENRGCKASKILNDNIRNRIVPTEDGLESLTAYRKPFGEKCVSPLSLFTKSLNGGSNSHIQANETQAQLVTQQAYDFPFVTKGSKAIQALDDSWGLQCSLEDELNQNHQDVVILDLEDSHKLLNNFWVDLGKDTALIATSLNTANGWFQHTTPIFDAKGLVKQFGDINIKADIVESKGKQFIAFSGKKNGKEILHALVNGTRINMNGKKYPINSPKVQQVGLSPKARANGFKGAGVLTFVVSAAIATTDLVFKDDYHLVDWFGNVGADMFKALLQ
ncbi:hypothetical protein, partial [Aliivibrio fischeri]|uniref:hypothetical protein n=1 Tax=Aliivibrio fischeri TaxID=668 RepID=UPI0009BF11F0